MDEVKHVVLTLKCKAHELIDFGSKFPGHSMTILFPAAYDVSRALCKTFGSEKQSAKSQEVTFLLNFISIDYISQTENLLTIKLFYSMNILFQNKKLLLPGNLGTETLM